MYLVDTSVWIHYLREEQNASVNFLAEILEHNIPFGITSLIYQEILQGCASLKDFEQIVKELGSQFFYHPLDATYSYQHAAKLYFSCRKQGITIRSSINCLIAQIALEHDLQLLHNDKDFLQIQKIVPELQLVSF